MNHRWNSSLVSMAPPPTTSASGSKRVECCVEVLEAADAHPLHPFQVELDAFLGDVAVHPVPPDARFGALGWVLEAPRERVARVLRGDNPCPHQRGQENCPAGLPGSFKELHIFL